MPFGNEHVVAGGELLRGHFEELALETLAQQRACTLTQVTRERSRVGAEHAHHEVHDAGCAAGSVVAIAHAILRERDVAEHAEQGKERERDDPSPLLTGNRVHQLEDVRVRDAIELRAELERRERVEVRGGKHFALRGAHQRVEEAERHARQTRDSGRQLDEVRHSVAEHGERLLGRPLRQRLVREARPRPFVRKNGLEVSLEDERAISLEEQGARERDDARHSLARDAHRLAEVLRDDRGALGWPGVIPGIGEASEPLQQDLQLEEDVVLLVERQPVKPRLAGLSLLAPEAARLAEEIRVGIALERKRRSRSKRRGHLIGRGHHPQQYQSGRVAA